MAKSAGYWERRSTERLVDAEKQSDKYIERIQKMYSRASKNIQREIDNVYKNYSKETGLDQSQLRVLLSAKETSRLWKKLKEKGLDKYVLDNYKSRISRLEQIQAQLYAQTKELYSEEVKESTECYRGIINDSYSKAIYDVQQGTGYDFSFNKIDKNLVDELLNEPWSGKNYSQRIWKNTDILADSVSEIVGGALLSGQGIEKTERQIRERFNVGKYYSTRLVRTEANHFHNEADARAYEEMGVEEYVFLAVLDGRTSPVCQEHDKKHYKLSERVSGVNYPPLHPNCRSTTGTYLGEEVEAELMRRATDPVTGESKLVKGMSYPEWKESVYAAHEKEKVDNSLKDPLRFKRVKPADQQQFENYKRIFPEIKTIDKFRDIKYNDPERWETLKKQYRILNQYKVDSGSLSNEDILRLDHEAISFKRNELPKDLKKSGNIAIAEIDGKTLFAHSSVDDENSKGYDKIKESAKEKLVLKNKERFDPLKVGGYFRYTDSEYKLFDYIASIKSPEDTFTVNLLSERCMCASCMKVMEDFKKMFPNATVNAVSNKRMKNPWKYRG